MYLVVVVVVVVVVVYLNAVCLIFELGRPSVSQMSSNKRLCKNVMPDCFAKSALSWVHSLWYSVSFWMSLTAHSIMAHKIFRVNMMSSSSCGRL